MSAPVEPSKGEPSRDDAVLGAAARASVLTAVGAMVAAVAGFALTVVVARGLGAYDTGVVFAGVAFTTILIFVAALGADTGVVWAIPRALALHRPHEVRTLVRWSFPPVVAASALLAAAVWLGAPQIAGWIADGSDTAVATVRVFACGVLVGAPSWLAVQTTRALGSVVPLVALQQIALPLLRLGGAMLLIAAAAATSTRIAWSWVVPLALVGLVAAAVVRLRLKPLPRSGPVEASRNEAIRNPVRELWSFSAKRSIASIAAQMLTWTDVILVAWLASPAVAGVYAAASRFATTGRIALEATRLAVSPAVSRAFSRRDLREVSLLAQTSVLWAAALSWPLYLVLAIYPRTVLGVLGEEFTEGATALTLLSLGMVVVVALGNVGMLLNMSGRAGLLATNVSIALGVNVGLNLVLIPRLGAAGAAIAWLAALALENTIGLFQVHRLGVTTHTRAFLKVAIVVPVTVLGIGLGVELIAGDSIAGLLVTSGLLALVLPVVYYRMRQVLRWDSILSGRRSGPL